jgi:AcrR family transcriptional regulator
MAEQLVGVSSERERADRVDHLGERLVPCEHLQPCHPTILLLERTMFVNTNIVLRNAVRVKYDVRVEPPDSRPQAPPPAALEPLPQPPRRPSAQRDGAARRHTPRRRSLTREAIVEAALKVLDAEGLDAMTMRRVAQELQTGAASLYAYFEDKDELVAAVIERVIGELPPPPAPDPERWQEQLKESGRAMRAMLAAHNDIARAAFARIPFGESALAGMDAVIGYLRAGGLPDQVAAYAADVLPLYVTAVAYEESIYSRQGISPEAFTEFATRMRDYFAALPPERFPNLNALAGPLTLAPAGDERFEFGMEVLIRGLASLAAEA